MATPAEPGTPRLDAERVSILGATKADPVLFIRPPVVRPTEDRNVRTYRALLRRTRYPWDVLNRLRDRFARHPADGRGTLLREGYLYADEPRLAYALVDRIRVKDLFGDPRIWLSRGARLYHAERQPDGSYRYLDGERAGRTLHLLLFDRVGTGTPPPPLHRDLRALRYRLHFDRARVVRLTGRYILADLRYGSVWVPSVLEADGAHLGLVCELPPAGTRKELQQDRDRRARRQDAVQKLRATMRAEIDEALPFDEPRTEYGQQDGRLRHKWESAYRLGKRTFRFQGDRYSVFNRDGRPLVPEVCVDFLLDTLERASGTWWRPAGERRGRVVGGLDYSALPRADLRRVPHFVRLAERSPDRFDFFAVPPRQRVALRFEERLYAYLAKHADTFIPGDMVVIRGYVPWEKPWRRHVMHYHSFFVYESDPLTGMPMLLVGNPGVPDIRTWRFEALRTPKRRIYHRIRPRLDWLERILASAMPAPPDPPPLVAGS